ncbi:MAG: hypothetical protein Q9209_003946 [Squamulea sp. 1 TL-2023]
MSSSSEVPIAEDFVPLEVPKATFLGLLWGSLWVSFLFVLFRAYVRFTVFRRFFADDGMVLLAWILILIGAALWQNMIDDLYLIYAVSVGAVQPPNNLLAILDQYTHQTIAVTMLNLFSLWSVKAALLTLFFKLGHNVRGHKIIWWIAAGATVIGLAISIGVQNWQCITGSQMEAIAKCSTEAYGDFIYRSLRVQAAWDIITDAFILAVPIKILWNVQISLRSKIGLVVLFSLTIFTMIIAILKVTLTLRTDREDDSWLYMWAGVEPAVAIIIACGISYRALVSKEPRSSNKYSGEADQRRLRYGASHATSNGTGNESRVRAGKSSSESSSMGEEVVPLDVIHVRKDYDVIPGTELGLAGGQGEVGGRQ